ncbi:DUF3859 domain-containing protein [Cerasicoccus arenae]|uniref:DUF3859 domain-containing protein n=1 Tax=Cerasicoccus arenae TaxID=424488 RepID=A0A8J3GF51_9BACT|nr:DUF3859 domain-containing protein [Cerasicoccus arenae]MBK1857322.1 DUF3859 domain-containing protein [Cerasicoccus arenae]GHC08738.1 hypothetical protein GCM10007047_27430 [Cerasicoccus arenae]
MRFYSISGFAFLLLAALLHKPSLEVVPMFYGHVMRTTTGETTLAPDSPSGLSMDGDWVVLEADTWIIPNCMAHGLGLEIGIMNVPDGIEELRLEVDFPPMTLPSGKINSHMESMQPIYTSDGFGYFDFYYFFDEEFERGLGEWRFKLYHEDRLLYDQAFTVVACPE